MSAYTLIRRDNIRSREDLLVSSGKVLEAVGLAQQSYPFELLVQALGLYEAAGRDEASADLYRGLAVANPRAFKAHLKLGEMYLRRGENEAAGREFQRAVELEGKGSIAFEAAMKLASLYSGQGDVALAERWFLEAAQRMPAWAHHPYNALGGLYRSQGRLTEAAEAYERAIDSARTQLHDPNVPPVLVSYHEQLAQVSQELGQVEAARESYQAILQLRPDSPGLKARLEVLDWTEAKVVWVTGENGDNRPMFEHPAPDGSRTLAFNGQAQYAPALSERGEVRVVAAGTIGDGRYPLPIPSPY